MVNSTQHKNANGPGRLAISNSRTQLLSAPELLDCTNYTVCDS